MQGSESYSDKKIRCLYGLRVQVPSQVPSILKMLRLTNRCKYNSKLMVISLYSRSLVLALKSI